MADQRLLPFPNALIRLSRAPIESRRGGGRRRGAAWTALLLLAAVACAAPAREPGGALNLGRATQRMEDVFEQAAAFAKGGRRVLYVSDIDSTLLAAPQDLGSTPWFGERIAAFNSLRATAQGLRLRARRFQQVLALWNRVVAAAPRMDLIEPGVPAGIRALQRAGIKTMALTARGNELSGATLRQLAAAGIDFAPGALGPDVADLKLPGSERSGQVRSGVVFASGQEKGRLLLELFARTGFRPDAVVFVDDTQSNDDAMRAALAPAGIDVVAYRYDRRSEQARRYPGTDRCVARVELKAFLERGSLLSNDAAAAQASPCPVSAREENRLLYGTPDPLRP